MPVTGTILFSHILPVVFGFFGLLLVITGIMEEKKIHLVLGILLFVAACILPFIVLRAMLL